MVVCYLGLSEGWVINVVFIFRFLTGCGVCHSDGRSWVESFNCVFENIYIWILDVSMGVHRPC